MGVLMSKWFSSLILFLVSSAAILSLIHILFDAFDWQESGHTLGGNSLFLPIATPFGRLGLGTCYDLRFPEVALHAALQGAELLIYPSAWVDGPLKALQWKTLLDVYKRQISSPSEA